MFVITKSDILPESAEMTLHQTNLSTAQLRAIDAAHHLHPFTDTKGLNAEGARVIVKAEGVAPVGF